MALLDVVFRALNKAGDAFIEMRREDGHGSDSSTPTHVTLDSEEVTVKQGTAGATAWPVDIGGATVSVSNLQQLAISTDIDESAHDLLAAAFSKSVPYATDTLLDRLAMRFTTRETRTITVSHDDGTEIAQMVGDESLDVVLDFEDYGIDQGSTITVAITQTVGACSVDVTLTSKIGSAALGGNPVLGESNAFIGNVGFGNTSLLDSFGRMRVSEPRTVFSTKQIYDNNALFYGGFGEGEIEYIPERSLTRLRIPASTVGVQTFAAHQHAAYQPGKSQLLQITSVFGPMAAGVIRRVGMRNSFGERICIEQNGNDGKAYSVVESMVDGIIDRRAIAKEDWDDTLDGSGDENNPSGIEVIPGKNHLINIDWQWLSAGRLRFAYAFVGQPTVFDTRIHGNNLSVPWIRCPEMQPFWEIETTSSQAEDVEFDAICAAISSEGGIEPSGISFGVTTGATAITVNTTFEPVLALRSAALYKGEPNVVLARLRSFGVYCDDDIIYRMVWFPSAVTGGTWSDVGGDSSLQYNINPTSITGGQTVDEDFIYSSGSGSNAQGSDLMDVISQRECISRTAGNDDSVMMVLLVRSITGNVDVRASMRWVEDIG